MGRLAWVTQGTNRRGSAAPVATRLVSFSGGHGAETYAADAGVPAAGLHKRLDVAKPLLPGQVLLLRSGAGGAE